MRLLGPRDPKNKPKIRSLSRLKSPAAAASQGPVKRGKSMPSAPLHNREPPASFLKILKSPAAVCRSTSGGGSSPGGGPIRTLAHLSWALCRCELVCHNDLNSLTHLSPKQNVIGYRTHLQGKCLFDKIGVQGTLTAAWSWLLRCLSALAAHDVQVISMRSLWSAKTPKGPGNEERWSLRLSLTMRLLGPRDSKDGQKMMSLSASRSFFSSFSSSCQQRQIDAKCAPRKIVVTMGNPRRAAWNGNRSAATGSIENQSFF